MNFGVNMSGFNSFNYMEMLKLMFIYASNIFLNHNPIKFSQVGLDKEVIMSEIRFLTSTCVI